MKLQILSDTHHYDYDISEDADIVVHAGDFCNNLSGCLEFDSYCKEIGKTPIFVLGNHDYYGSDLYNTIKFFEDNPQYNCLYPGKEIKVGDYTFVGGTLFTNFRKATHTKSQFKLNKKVAEYYIRDFEQITINNGRHFVTAHEMLEVFNKTLSFINTYKDKDKTIVVTHFPPSLQCLDPYWGTHPDASRLNPYFINDIDIKGHKLWISGHTHTAVDTVEDGCRLMINPFGYPNEHGKNGYRSELLVDLKDIYE